MMGGWDDGTWWHDAPSHGTAGAPAGATDDQRMQVRTLLGNHAKEAIRLRADIGVMAVDLRQFLEADPVDLPK